MFGMYVAEKFAESLLKIIISQNLMRT